MKFSRSLGATALLLSSSFVAPSAYALELLSSFYVGAGAGYTTFTRMNDLYRNDYNDPFSKTDLKDDSFGLMLFAGWNFLPGFSAELVLIDFGKYEYDEADYDVTGERTAAWKDEGALSGVGVAVRYDTEVTQGIDFYARLGLMSWTWDVDSISYYDDTGIRTVEKRGFDDRNLFASLGFRYALTRNWAMFADLTFLDSEWEIREENFNSRQPAYSIMGGIQYYFAPPVSLDTNRSATAKRDGREREVTACDPKYNDISGMLCQ